MPPPTKEKLKKLYGNLKAEGYDLPEYNTFEVDMADDTKRNKLHSSLLKEGYELPDYATFTTDMGYTAAEKKNEAAPTESLGGTSPSQTTDSTATTADTTVSMAGTIKPQTVQPAQPTPEGWTAPDFAAIDKKATLFPKQYEQVLQAKDFAAKNPSKALDAFNSIKDFQRFSDKTVAKFDRDNGLYIDENGQPKTAFKEGDIVTDLPTDRPMNDGITYKSGFAQFINGAWKPAPEPPNPTFTTDANPLADVVVSAFAKKKGGKTLTDLTGEQYSEDDDYNRAVMIANKPDDKIDDTEFIDMMNRVAPNEKDIVYESLWSNRFAEGGKKLPAFLSLLPEVTGEYRKILTEKPNYVATQEGNFTALNEAVTKAYELDKEVWEPMNGDVNNYVDSKEFFDMSERAKKGEDVRAYFEQPNVKLIIDRAEKQRKGYGVVTQIGRMFPKRMANEEALFQKQQKDVTMLDKIANAFKSAYVGLKDGLKEVVQFADEKVSAITGGTDEDIRMKSRMNSTEDGEDAVADYVPENFVNGFMKMVGGVSPAFATGGLGTMGKLTTAAYFGLGSAQSTIKEYRQNGLDEKTANIAGGINGALMALATWGLGGHPEMKGFQPSFETTQMFLNPATREAASKQFGKELLESKIINFGKGLLGNAKSAAELRIAEQVHVMMNDYVNKITGSTLNTESGGVEDFIGMVGSFAMLHGLTTIAKRKTYTEKEKAALINEAAMGNMKAVMDGLEQLKRSKDVDKNAIRKMEATLTDFAGVQFPKGITKEQKSLLYLEVEKKKSYEEAAKQSEFGSYYKEKIKEVDAAIKDILDNPAGATGKVKKLTKEVDAEVKATANDPFNLRSTTVQMPDEVAASQKETTTIEAKETAPETKKSGVSVVLPESNKPNGLLMNPIIANISLPFNEGVNTGLVKNSKGAVYHDKNSTKLEKLGYSKEEIDNLSQTELNEIIAKNIENPNVVSSVKLPEGDANTTEQLLQEAESSNSPLLELAKAFRKLGIGRIKTNIIENFQSFFGGNAGGQWANGQLYVNKDGNSLITFFHEATHGLTADKINAYLTANKINKFNAEDGKPTQPYSDFGLTDVEVDAVRNLDRIFNESKVKINELLGGGKDRTKGHYGFTNVNEFVAEAFSNKEFQNLLKNLPTEGKNPTLFKQFLDAIAKFLGIKDASILNDIFHHTENLANKSKKPVEVATVNGVEPIQADVPRNTIEPVKVEEEVTMAGTPKSVQADVPRETEEVPQGENVKVTPVQQGGKTIIDENGNLTDELPNQFENLKADNDLDGLNKLYSTVKIFLNGVAQSKGGKAVEQFKALKKEIEDYAESSKTKPNETNPDSKAKEEVVPSVVKAAQGEPKSDIAGSEKVGGDELGGEVASSNWREVYKASDAFRKSDILKEAARVGNEKTLSDVLDMLVKGSANEGNIAWEVAHRTKSKETFERAVSNRALRKSTTDENIQSLREKRFGKYDQPNDTPTNPTEPVQPIAGKPKVQGTEKTVSESADGTGQAGAERAVPVDGVGVADKVKKAQKDYDAFLKKNKKHIDKKGVKDSMPDDVRKEGARLQAELVGMQQVVNDAFAKLSKERKEQSRVETEKINADFESKQVELQKEYGFTDAEIMEASIEQKLEGQLPLTKSEVEYANENMFVPKGFKFDKDGLVETKKPEKQEKAIGNDTAATPSVEEPGNPKQTGSGGEGKEKQPETVKFEDGAKSVVTGKVTGRDDKGLLIVKDKKGYTYHVSDKQILEKDGTIVRKPTPREQNKTDKQYEDVDATTTNQTGRISIDPITTAIPRKTSAVQVDLSEGMGQRILTAKGKRRKSLGSYSPSDTSVKIKHTGDLDTTAHEIGHLLDDRHGILKNITPAIEAELSNFSQYGSTPPKGHPNPQDYINGEGFAEFVRAYIVNPTAAKQAAPNTFAAFDKALTAKEKQTLDVFSSDVRTLAGANGLDRIIANIAAEMQPTGLLKKITDTFKTKDGYSITWFDKMRATLTNPFRAFDKAVKFAQGLKGIDEVLPKDDPMLLARLLNGGYTGKINELLNNGLENAKGEVIKDANGNAKSMSWLLEKLDATTEASAMREKDLTEAYMIAERTVELAGRFSREDVLTGIGAGLFKDLDAAKAALRDFDNLPKEQQKRLKETAKRYREMADHAMQYMVDKGRMSKESYDQIKADNLQYVALNRVMESGVGEEITPFTGGDKGSIGSKKETVKKVQGSSREIVSPFVSLADNINKMYREADRNQIMKQFRDLLVEPRGMHDGDPINFSQIGAKVSESSAATLPIFVDGKVEHWQFHPAIKATLSGLDGVIYRLPKAVTIMPTILRWGVTHAPAFAARNFIRDMQDRLIKSNNSGITDLVGKKQDWADVARRGGLNSGYYFTGKESYEGLIKESIKELSGKGNTTIVNPLKLGRVWEKYEDLLKASETTNRVAEYRGAFKKAKEKGMDDYNASLYAAGQARELLDFAIMGHWMKVINQVIPFSNAAVQGLRTTAKKAADHPGTFAARMMIYSVLPQVAMYFLNHKNQDDADEYESLPAHQRDMYWNFKIGDNRWLSVPKPYELSVPAAGIDRLLSRYVHGNENAYEGYGGTVLKNMMPIDESAAAGPLRGIVEIIANKDFFRDQYIINPREDGLDLALRNTQNASRLGKFIQNVAGMDARHADHLMQSTFSYFGKYALSLSDIGRESSKYGFSINDLGFTKSSPAYNSADVQKLLKYTKRYGLAQSPEFDNFSEQLTNYFGATTNADKDKEAKKLVAVSKQVLKDWEDAGVGEEKIANRGVAKMSKERSETIKSAAEQYKQGKEFDAATKANIAQYQIENDEIQKEADKPVFTKEQTRFKNSDMEGKLYKWAKMTDAERDEMAQFVTKESVEKFVHDYIKSKRLQDPMADQPTGELPTNATLADFKKIYKNPLLAALKHMEYRAVPKKQKPTATPEPIDED